MHKSSHKDDMKMKKHHMSEKMHEHMHEPMMKKKPKKMMAQKAKMASHKSK